MAKTLFVRPEGSAWVVGGDAAPGLRSFESGAAAENAAKAMAEALARSGQPAEVHIHLRDGRLGARYIAPTRQIEWA